MKSKKHLPQSEAEWLQTGAFSIQRVTVHEIPIKCAITTNSSANILVTMVGGIPRESDRQRELPLINKLFGRMAVEGVSSSIVSLLYNQPATGGSGGDWRTQTLQSRTEVLKELVVHFTEKLYIQDHAIIGSSAGAYMAVRVVRKLREVGIIVSKLILLSPAAYPEKIESIPYGAQFTDLIRQPWDVATSPIFEDLEVFIHGGGRVLACFFEVDDPPIPIHIQEYLSTHIRNLPNYGIDTSVLIIPGVSHNFRRLRKKRRENVVNNDSIRATAETFLTFLK